jgi:diguanylate cyclase (GGDEF)-like protein/PAS domain S-box-containing protein
VIAAMRDPTDEDLPDPPQYWPSPDALALVHEFALLTGRLVTWSHDPVTGAVWWSDPVHVAFGLGRRGGDDGRWLLAPLLHGSAATGTEHVDFEVSQTVEDQDGDPVVLLIRARPVPGTGELAGILADITERRSTETALRDLVDRYRLLVDLSPDAIAVHQMGVLRFLNPAAVRFGQLSSADEGVGRMITDFVHPDSVADMVSRITSLTEPGMVSQPAEARIVRRDGTELVMETTSVRTTWDGQPAFQVILRDLTERRLEDQRFASVVDALDEGVIMVDMTGELFVVNRSARAMLGAALDGVTSGRELLERLTMVNEKGEPLAPDDHPSMLALCTGRPRVNVVIGIDEPGGRRRWVSTNSQPVRIAGTSQVQGVVCSFNDITHQREADLQLIYQATHDPLTGLSNREVVVGQLQQRLDRNSGAKSTVGLLFIDLDRFKAVNDTLGHVCGDEFLTVIGRRLLEFSPEADLVGRLAGDEFLLIVDRVEDRRAVVTLAEEVAHRLGEPVRLRTGHSAAVSASIGVAVGDRDSFDAEGLLRSADAAMYRAKQMGRCRVELYDESLGARIRHRTDLQNELRLALDQGDITVRYQPIADLVTRRLVGVEALARWEHPVHGWIPPDDFVAVAERSGLILPLGEHILRTAVEEFTAWSAQQPDTTRRYLTVNVSNRQLTSYTVELVRKALEEAALEPDLLWLEITESALVTDPTSAGRILHELRDLGVHLAIDDFGTGYSSLLSLKRYPVELVKIDRSFIEGLGTDPDSEAIVTAVIRLAQSLNLATVAEGVENDVQHSRLVELGCRLAQGYLLGEPKELAALSRLAARWQTP